MTRTPTGPTPIEIEFRGHTIRGILHDSRIAASLADRLPLTLTFTDFGQQEKIADLPAALDTTDAPRASEAPAASIAYYAPSQALVLYYENVGRYPGIVPLGTLDDITALRAATSTFTATISRSR